MTTPPVTVGMRATAQEAARRMEEQAVGCVLVTEEGTLRGIVTDRDIAVRAVARAAGGEAPVAGLMSAPVITVGASDDLERAYHLFRRHDIRRLPVLDGGRPVGILAIDDLFCDALQRLADLLTPLSWSALREQARPAADGRVDRPGRGSR
ncbi:CBS domain-containing protein [Streptomyces sp. ET3-23]|uniref:CBS domain-containing protein n=1 Tax=Streptomyces sp. ET3-23 TaxID=2885643 RepID=UPI001D11E263|nr:CBS domain-containing protein [Streptomyces sp. ET3-23]MCC2274411.1 CBS domain-containing protein [Streptomyces sp. ET3-23]